MTADPALVDLEGIPSAAKPLWTKLLGEDLQPVHHLFREVRAYQQTIAQRTEWSESNVDPTLAQGLVEASLKLLGMLSDSTPETTRRLVQAAVRYFVIADDADADLDSILGLDDDAEVVNAVLRHLGHDEWLVEVL